MRFFRLCAHLLLHLTGSLLQKNSYGAPSPQLIISDSSIASAVSATKLTTSGKALTSACSISMVGRGVDDDILINFSCDSLPSGSGKAIAAFIVLDAEPTKPIALKASSMVVWQIGFITSTGNAMICPSTTTKPGGRFSIPYLSKYPLDTSKYTVMIAYISTIPASSGTTSTSSAGLICGATHNKENPFCEAYGTDKLVNYLSDPVWTKGRASNVPARGLDVYLATVMLGPTAEEIYEAGTEKMFKSYDVQIIYFELKKRAGFRDLINAFSRSRNGGDINSVTPSYTNIYVQNWLSSYGTVQKNNTVTDAQIRAALQKMSDENKLIYHYKTALDRSPSFNTSHTYRLPNNPSIFSQGDVHVVAIHLQPGFYVSGPNKVGTTCFEICAYHSTMTLRDGKKLQYSVIPYADNDNCSECNIEGTTNSIKVMASHEFSEILTKAALGDNYVPHSGAEIADLCSWEKFRSSNQERTAFVSLQMLWNVQNSSCSVF